MAGKKKGDAERRRQASRGVWAAILAAALAAFVVASCENPGGPGSGENNDNNNQNNANEIPEGYFSVTFVAEGASNVPKAQIVKAGEQITLPVEDNENPGGFNRPASGGENWLIAAWVNEAADPSERRSPGAPFVVEGNVTLRADWARESELSFLDLKSEGETILALRGRPESYVTLPPFPAGETRRPDKNEFTGWGASAKDENPRAAGSVFDFEGPTPTQLVLHAVWKPWPLISFKENAEGDDVANMPEETRARPGLSFELPADTKEPTRDYHDFMGWQIDGAGDLYENGDALPEITADTALYAAWKIWPLISFDKNVVAGEDVDDMPLARRAPRGAPYELPADTKKPTRDTHNFGGWQIDGAGDLYNNGDILPEIDADTILFAFWSVKLLYEIEASPSALDFGVEPIGGQPAAKDITIRNTGTGVAVISAITLKGANAADFALTGHTAISEIAVEGSAVFSARPKAGLEAGSYGAEIEIAYEDGVAVTVVLSFILAPQSVIDGSLELSSDLDSDALISPPSPMGWHLAPPMEGRWRLGYMRPSEGQPLEIPITSVAYTWEQMNVASFSVPTTDLPGGLGTWSVTRVGTFNKMPGTTSFVDLRATQALRAIPGNANALVYRRNYDGVTYGGAQPIGAGTNMPGFEFRVDTTIDINGYSAFIDASFTPVNHTSGTFSAVQGNTRINDREIAPYMTDSQNPADVWPTAILHEDFEHSNGVWKNTDGTVSAAELRDGMGWFTHATGGNVSASGGFDGENRPGSEGSRSLRLAWEITSGTAQRTIRIGQRQNFQQLNLANYTHVRFWARTNEAGAGEVRFAHGLNVWDNGRQSAVFTVDETWKQYEVALVGTRANVNYIAFQVIRSAVMKGELYIDDVEFIRIGDPVAVPASERRIVVLSQHAAVYPSRTFRIALEVDATHFFSDAPIEGQLPFPIFERGTWVGDVFQPSNVFYWRDGEGNDHWNIDSGEPPVFYDFNPQADLSKGELTLRAEDPEAEGVTWVYDEEGPDAGKLRPVTAAHYEEPAILAITVDGRQVGTLAVEIVGHEQNADNELTGVDIRLAYAFEPSFEPYIAALIVNGEPASLVDGAAIVSLPRRAPGAFSLKTRFEFRIPGLN
ncbi:MAG: choice-of-anchor D domain-containing protein [Treponema sp.]|nr:choice-of-anchor D domain-containing protein [Treponema sp.]